MSLYFQRTEGFPHPFATTPREKLFSMLCCIWYGGSGQLHLPTRRVVKLMIANKILKQTFQFNLDSPLKFGRFVLWTYRRIPTSVCDDTKREVVLRVLLHRVGGLRTAAFAYKQSCLLNDLKQDLEANFSILFGFAGKIWTFCIMSVPKDSYIRLRRHQQRSCSPCSAASGRGAPDSCICVNAELLSQSSWSSCQTNYAIQLFWTPIGEHSNMSNLILTLPKDSHIRLLRHQQRSCSPCSSASCTGGPDSCICVNAEITSLIIHATPMSFAISTAPDYHY